MTIKEHVRRNPGLPAKDLLNVDGPAGWVVAAACIWISFITGITLRPLGFYFVNFVARYESGRESVAWTVSLTSASVIFSGVLSKLLLRWFSPWSLMVLGSLFQVTGVFVAYFAPNVYALAASFGFLHGIGAGLVFVLSGTFIQKHFQENRSFVMKLNVTASCAAGIAFPRLLLFFRQEYGYTGLILLSGGVLLNVPVLCILLRKPANPKINNTMCTTTSPKVFTIDQPSSSSSCSNLRSGEKSMFKMPMFYFTAISHLVFFYIINLHSSIVVDTILSKGVPVVEAITVAPVVTIFDWIGRVIIPLSTEKGYTSRTTLVMIDYLVVGVGLFVLPYANNYGTVLATCVSFGAFSGHAITVHNPLMAQYVGFNRVNVANVIVTCFAAATFFTKPYVIGYFRDHLGSYDDLYRIMGIVTFSNAAAWLVVNSIMRHRKTRTWTTSNSQLKLCDEPVLINYQSIFLTSMMAE
ncbi:monocarboxylate transporter 13-like [Ixodes scapularis]|uniref:monocarboxylate transporter 13-like n=1 Tax=Ixodes scapularis TaxID=6945 RepID=UPI001A9CD01C|nr:monocarboxylate transporter 13-like [Ixodes scapularis]